jgi:hypothetical protein
LASTETPIEVEAESFERIFPDLLNQIVKVERLGLAAPLASMSAA